MAQPAHAAKVEVREGGTVAVTPGGGERSNLNIAARYTLQSADHAQPDVTSVIVYDEQTPPTSGFGCVPHGPFSVECTVVSSAPALLELRLGDLGDTAEVTGLGGELDGGGGDDRLTWVSDGLSPPGPRRVDGGPGRDDIKMEHGVASGGADKDVLKTWNVDGKPETLRGTTLLGGDGDDELTGTASGRDHVRLEGGDGTDVLDVDARDVAGDTSAFGGGGADQLSGGWQSRLDGGPGADRLAGGQVRYDGRSEGIVVTLDGLANDGARGEGDNVVAAKELIGTPFADELTGGPAGDILVAAGGDDLLTGGAGADYLLGGSGRDRLRARDGAADTVACGQDDAKDLALLDAADRLAPDADCEHAAVE